MGLKTVMTSGLRQSGESLLSRCLHGNDEAVLNEGKQTTESKHRALSFPHLFASMLLFAMQLLLQFSCPGHARVRRVSNVTFEATTKLLSRQTHS